MFAGGVLGRFVSATITANAAPDECDAVKDLFPWMLWLGGQFDLCLGAQAAVIQGCPNSR
jgi:hypothetical protein